MKGSLAFLCVSTNRKPRLLSVLVGITDVPRLPRSPGPISYVRKNSLVTLVTRRQMDLFSCWHTAQYHTVELDTLWYMSQTMQCGSSFSANSVFWPSTSFYLHQNQRLVKRVSSCFRIPRVTLNTLVGTRALLLWVVIKSCMMLRQIIEKDVSYFILS